MVIETLDEFTARHGDYVVLENGTRLFANGATSRQDDDWGRLGSRREPPTDPIAKLRVRRVYVAAKLEREVKAFHAYRDSVLEQLEHAQKFPMSCPPPDSDRAERQLKAGRERITNLQTEIARIDRELSETPEAKALREREKREAEVRQECADRHRTIAAINVSL